MTFLAPLHDPLIFTLVALIVGLCVGSFLNVVIHRLPLMMEHDWQQQCSELHGQTAAENAPLTLSRPASRCPHCGHRIGALDNIPLLSWLLLKGKCRGCQAPISIRYPAVELLTGLLSAGLAWHYGFGMAALGALLFLWAMIALTFIDADTQLLPDAITLPLLWLGLLFNLGATYVPLDQAVVGAVAGYLSLWSVYWLFKLATGKEGMGFGDFKLLAAIGAWAGWQALPVTILLSSVVGAVIGIALMIAAKRGHSVPMPFGPYLAIAGTLALVYGQELNRIYLGLY